MNLNASSAPTRWRDPSRIGQVRPSHLVTTAGVGSVVDLPTMSVIVRSLDAWSAERQEAIEEPRLLTEVQRVLGHQVRALRKAPWDPSESDDPYTRVGVPVTPFPGWVRCPRCHRLGPLDPPGQFELVHRYGRRPDLAKWVHAQCQKQTTTRDVNKRACVPARFIVTCERSGHLDDFPYVEFVHANATQPCGGAKLTMIDSASTLGPQVTVRCAECGASRSIQEAAGQNGWQKLPLCRGRHPHQQRFESCGANLRLMVLGASNLWFSITASALHLPQSESIEDQIRTHWETFEEVLSQKLMQKMVDGMNEFRALRAIPSDELWAVVEKIRAAGGPPVAEASSDLLEDEWRLLAKPTTERQDADFRAVPTPTPQGYDQLLEQVVQVTRLREVQALIAFTRINAPDRRDLAPRNRVSLARGTAHWVPAVEQRGEGIFLQLREDAVASWTAKVANHPRLVALHHAHQRWCRNRAQTFLPGFPVARFVLLHTFSHLLMRQVALECGYSSSSIRERLYIGSPTQPAAGVLLSTAASDSEGTLGGLVALGSARYLKRLLDQAVEDASRCSSDPLCAEHVPEFPSDTLHAAACHACLFASETSCETNNRWLDRAAIVDLTGDGLAFLP
ncbi:DrmB family protein [Streptomyces sp. NPDC058441]|uniref:DrmB family protein n=1 Tax=Streptomyces sp. NPDC058441 TaxID=3346502 RepID=UPI00364C5B07